VRPGGGKELVWPNGSRAEITSAETTEQRGSEYDIVWLTEVVAWPRNKRLDTWANIGFSTRTGDAKTIVDSTPKKGHPIVSTKAGLIAKEAEWNPRVQWRGGSVERNAINLARGYVQRERAKWDGTRRGKEELDGVDAEEGGGLIHDDWIEQGRRNMPSVWKRRIVTCDPTVTNPKPGGHTAGLLSGGEGTDGQIYITHDQSGMMGPNTWAPKLIDEAIDIRADVVVIETNRGGNVIDFALSLVARERGLQLVVVELMATPRYSPGVINLKLVHSRKDKETRMDPAIMQYKAGRVSHCKEADLESLEETLTTWEPETASGRDSPGDLDCTGMLVVEARLLYEELRNKDSAAEQRALNQAARAGRRPDRAPVRGLRPAKTRRSASLI
jgi:phage terminase large subunit-like protein